MTTVTEQTLVLWNLASKLKEGVSPSAQVEIVCSLLFLRHAARASSSSGGRAGSLVVPFEASWEHIERATKGIAETLSRACQILEDVNPALRGVLTAADFHELGPWNEEQWDRALRDVVAGLSRMPELDDAMHAADLQDSFIDKSAESSGKRAGWTLLPAPLARLMVELLDLTDGVTICDPFCRSGRTLAICADRAKERRLTVTIQGQNPNRGMRAICRMSLLLRGVADARIDGGDALRSPMLDRHGRLERYGRIISAPPIHRNGWGAEEAAEDRWKRFPVIPPRNNADFAYILHAVAALENDGRAVLLTSSGVLFRQGVEASIRRMLVEQGLIDVIVNLPGGLLQGTNIASALMVLRRSISTRRGKVLLVDARHRGDRRPRISALSQAEIDDISTCVRRYTSVEGLAQVVPTNEVEHKQWNLNPAAYIPRDDEVHSFVDIAEQSDAIRQLEAERDDAAARMDSLIAELAALHGPR
jgi:type I restriction enzyme M protein